MTEELLQHIWQFRLYQATELSTVCGQFIQVVKPGEWNHDAGPDFLNARIKIGETLWAGNVELHLKASDWLKHQHQHNDSYQNIVLHVVLENDVPLQNIQGIPLITLELQKHINPDIINRYYSFKYSASGVPCLNQLNEVPDLIVHQTLERNLLDRLYSKMAQLELEYHHCSGDWETLLFRHILKSFGSGVNNLPFEMLSRSLSLSTLAKHADRLDQIEALLFGQAGMLNDNLSDAYAKALQNEYAFLSHKYHLVAIENHLWKFLRMRPSNFPSIRLAQIAALIHQSTKWWTYILETPDIESLRKQFSVKASEYWNTHYQFDKPSVWYEKQLGKTAIDTLLINAVAPLLFFYGHFRNEQARKEQALNLLAQLPAEENKWTNAFKTSVKFIHSAADSQGCLQLVREQCMGKRCLKCPIGNHLLKK